MKKYVLRNSGKEFKMGDTVDVTVTVNTPFGEAKCVKKVVVNEETLKLLIAEGLVIIQETEMKPLFRRIAKKLDLTLPDAELFVDIIHDASPYAAMFLLLDQASKKLNKGKDLSEYKRFYYVNVNGEVVTCQNRGIYNTPIFTSVEDASEALNLIEGYYRSVYGKQEDNKRNSN